MAKPDKKSKKRDRESRSPAITAGEDDGKSMLLKSIAKPSDKPDKKERKKSKHRD